MYNTTTITPSPLIVSNFPVWEKLNVMLFRNTKNWSINCNTDKTFFLFELNSFSSIHDLTVFVFVKSYKTDKRGFHRVIVIC